MRALTYLRWAHGSILLSQLLLFGDELDFGLIMKVVDIMTMFQYIGSILYALDFLAVVHMVSDREVLNEHIVQWLFIEVRLLLYMIITAAVFLMYI